MCRHRRNLRCIVLLIAVLDILGAECKEKEAYVERLILPDTTFPLDASYSSTGDSAQNNLNIDTINHGVTTLSPEFSRIFEPEAFTVSADNEGNVETTSTTISLTDTDDGNVDRNHESMNNKKSRRHVAHEAISVKLLKGEDNKISVTDLALSKEIVFLQFTGLNAYSVDYHYSKRILFYNAQNRIYREEVVGRLEQGGSPTVVVTAGMDGPVKMAVDWVHEKLYWLSVKQQTVEVANLNGSDRMLLFDNFHNIQFPNNIAIDPYVGHVFVVANHSIFRANLDGNNLTRLQLDGGEGKTVKCLTLDICKRRLYYSGRVGDADKGPPYIASSSYEGGNRKEYPLPLIDKNRWNDIFALDIFRNTIYFAHYKKRQTDTLWSADVTSTEFSPLLIRTANATSGGIWSVKVYHPEIQEKPKDNTCAA